MRAWYLLPIALVLASCGEEHQDIKEWMREISKDLHAIPPQVPKMVAYEPFTYKAEDRVDPFAAVRLGVKNQPRADDPFEKERQRPKEPAEAYALENMQMVGALRQNKRVFALVKADTNLFRLKVGDHLGQNFGRITGINETEVQILELVADSNGEVVERTSTLHLQEKAAEGKK